MLEKHIKGGLVIVGQLNLGGSLDTIYNAVNLAELAVEKGATTLLIPLNARKQLNELSDEMITKINIQYYTDLKDCLIKAILD
jgi:ATP-dependent Lon protease